MSIPAALLAHEPVRITPWPDEVVDRVGHDPRSPYVEKFWLSTLGPSTTWLLRYLADGLDGHPEGFYLEGRQCAHSLGLGDKTGKNSAYVRAFHRLVQFGLARTMSSRELSVRRFIPPLTLRQVEKLPEALRPLHESWTASDSGETVDEMRERARGLAISLFRLGETKEEVERSLMRWRFHPAIAHQASEWAWTRQRSAAGATGNPVGLATASL